MSPRQLFCQIELLVQNSEIGMWKMPSSAFAI